MYTYSPITRTTVTRELNVVTTCGQNYLAAIIPAYVTYNSDLMFFSCKPQVSSTSGYYCNSRSKCHSHLRFETFFFYFLLPSMYQYLIFCARKPLLLTTSGYNYNSKTIRHSDLRFEPVCNYYYRPGIQNLELTFCARKPQFFTTACYSRTNNVIATCNFNHYLAIVMVYVNYIQELAFCARKPKLSTASGY